MLEPILMRNNGKSRRARGSKAVASAKSCIQGVLFDHVEQNVGRIVMTEFNLLREAVQFALESG